MLDDIMKLINECYGIQILLACWQLVMVGILGLFGAFIAIFMSAQRELGVPWYYLLFIVHVHVLLFVMCMISSIIQNNVSYSESQKFLFKS